MNNQRVSVSWFDQVGTFNTEVQGTHFRYGIKNDKAWIFETPGGSLYFYDTDRWENRVDICESFMNADDLRKDTRYTPLLLTPDTKLRIPKIEVHTSTVYLVNGESVTRQELIDLRDKINEVIYP